MLLGIVAIKTLLGVLNLILRSGCRGPQTIESQLQSKDKVEPTCGLSQIIAGIRELASLSPNDNRRPASYSSRIALIVATGQFYGNHLQRRLDLLEPFA